MYTVCGYECTHAYLKDVYLCYIRTYIFHTTQHIIMYINGYNKLNVLDIGNLTPSENRRNICFCILRLQPLKALRVELKNSEYAQTLIRDIKKMYEKKRMGSLGSRRNFGVCKKEKKTTSVCKTPKNHKNGIYPFFSRGAVFLDTSCILGTVMG